MINKIWIAKKQIQNVINLSKITDLKKCLKNTLSLVELCLSSRESGLPQTSQLKTKFLFLKIEVKVTWLTITSSQQVGRIYYITFIACSNGSYLNFVSYSFNYYWKGKFLKISLQKVNFKNFIYVMCVYVCMHVCMCGCIQLVH